MERRARQARETRAYCKAHHYCVKCHGQDAYTLIGRSYCAECAEHHRTYSRKHYAARGGAKERAHDRAMRIERLQAGMCTVCGIPLAEGHLYVTCDKRRAKARNAKRKETELRTGYKTGAARCRWQYGECYKCGAPVKEGLSSYGTPYRMCDRCYADSMEGLKRAREAAQANGKGAHPWTKENRLAFGSTERSSRLNG